MYVYVKWTENNVKSILRNMRKLKFNHILALYEMSHTRPISLLYSQYVYINPILSLVSSNMQCNVSYGGFFTLTVLLLTSHHTKAGMGHVQKGINTHRMRKKDAIDCPAVLH